MKRVFRSSDLNVIKFLYKMSTKFCNIFNKVTKKLYKSTKKEGKMNVDKTNFGEKMKETRELKGISGNQFSKMLGISQANYSNYERGKTEPPLAIVVRIAQLLNVSVDYLLGVSDVSENRVVQSTVNGHNVNGSGNVVSAAADADEVAALKARIAELEIKLNYATELLTKKK